mgnify:CR=1 FL=1
MKKSIPEGPGNQHDVQGMDVTKLLKRTHWTAFARVYLVKDLTEVIRDSFEADTERARSMNDKLFSMN